jgi:hypothetical protein
MGKRRKKKSREDDYDEDQPENSNTRNIVIGIAVLLVLGGHWFFDILFGQKEGSNTVKHTKSFFIF